MGMSIQINGLHRRILPVLSKVFGRLSPERASGGSSSSSSSSSSPLRGVRGLPSGSQGAHGMGVSHLMGFAHEELLQLAVACCVGVVEISCEVTDLADVTFSFPFYSLACMA